MMPRTLRDLQIFNRLTRDGRHPNEATRPPRGAAGEATARGRSRDEGLDRDRRCAWEGEEGDRSPRRRDREAPEARDGERGLGAASHDRRAREPDRGIGESRRWRRMKRAWALALLLWPGAA